MAIDINAVDLVVVDGAVTLTYHGWYICTLTKQGNLLRHGSINTSAIRTVGEGKIRLVKEG